MNKLIDLTGKRYGKLTVIKRAEQNHVSPCGTVSVVWVCQCDCGNIVLVLGKNLRSGKSTNCGCIRKINLPKSRRTHGDSRNCRLYRIYHDMINRCKNPNTENYHRYGGRGISVCDEWLNSYEKFRNWALLNGYTDNLTLDHINNDGNYAPDNCRWVTHKENCQNRPTDYLKRRVVNGIQT